MRGSAVPARRLALEVLRRVSRPGPTLSDALATAEPAGLDARDRAFVQELVFGALRRRGLLDYVMARLVARPLDRLTPGILEVLRLGAYQLLFTRVAPHAALSESVELARLIEPRAAGVVNAVLRRLQREGLPSQPDPTRDPHLWLTTWGSLPAWLAERWLTRLGPERAVARARAFLEPAPTHFRLNPRRPDAPQRLADAGVRFAEISDLPGAFELQGGRLAELAADGVVYVQDAGSQMIARLAATAGLVLDACAAPGGKSLLLSDFGAHVVAVESSRRRLSTLRQLVRRWGADEITPVAADARRPPFRSPFATVLLDAPCSGLGTLGRRPDIRWRLQPHDLERHADQQRRMISALAPLVRPAGRLVYSTCSVETEENEGVIAPFLASHGDFSPDTLPPWAARHRNGDYLRIEPGPHGDGFFVAVLRRAAR